MTDFHISIIAGDFALKISIPDPKVQTIGWLKAQFTAGARQHGRIVDVKEFSIDGFLVDDIDCIWDVFRHDERVVAVGPTTADVPVAHAVQAAAALAANAAASTAATAAREREHQQLIDDQQREYELQQQQQQQQQQQEALSLQQQQQQQQLSTQQQQQQQQQQQLQEQEQLDQEQAQRNADGRSKRKYTKGGHKKLKLVAHVLGLHLPEMMRTPEKERQKFYAKVVNLPEMLAHEVNRDEIVSWYKRARKKARVDDFDDYDDPAGLGGSGAGGGGSDDDGDTFSGAGNQGMYYGGGVVGANGEPLALASGHHMAGMFVDDDGHAFHYPGALGDGTIVVAATACVDEDEDDDGSGGGCGGMVTLPATAVEVVYPVGTVVHNDDHGMVVVVGTHNQNSPHPLLQQHAAAHPHDLMMPTPSHFSALVSVAQGAMGEAAAPPVSSWPPPPMESSSSSFQLGEPSALHDLSSQPQPQTIMSMMLQDQGPSSISFCAEMPDGAVDISQTDPSPSSLPSSLLPISAGELVGLPPPPAVYDDVVVVAGSVVEALPLSSDYATMNEQPPLLIGTVSCASADYHDSQASSAADSAADDVVVVVAGSVVEALPLPSDYATMNEQPPLVIGTVSHASADDHDSQDSSAASAGDVAVVAGSVVEALPLPNNYATMNEQPPLVIGAVSHASADDHDSQASSAADSAADDVVVVAGSVVEAMPLPSDYATMNEQPPLVIGTVSHAAADDHDSQTSSAADSASADDVVVLAGSVVEALPLPNDYVTMNEQPPLVMGTVSCASADDHDSQAAAVAASTDDVVVVAGSVVEAMPLPSDYATMDEQPPLVIGTVSHAAADDHDSQAAAVVPASADDVVVLAGSVVEALPLPSDYATMNEQPPLVMGTVSHASADDHDSQASGNDYVAVDVVVVAGSVVEALPLPNDYVTINEQPPLVMGTVSHASADDHDSQAFAAVPASVDDVVVVAGSVVEALPLPSDYATMNEQPPLVMGTVSHDAADDHDSQAAAAAAAAVTTSADDVVVVAGSVVEALPLPSDYATMNGQPPLLIGTVSHAAADDHDSQVSAADNVVVVSGSVVEALPLPNNCTTMNEQPPLVMGMVSHASADDHDSEQGVMVVSAVVVEGSATENWNDGAVAVSGTVIATGGDVPTETATESLSATPVDLTATVSEATVSEAMRREVSGDAALPENCVVQHQVKSALVVEQASAAASLRLRQATPDEGKEAEERDENEDEDDLLGTGMALSCKSSYL